MGTRDHTGIASGSSHAQSRFQYLLAGIENGDGEYVTARIRAIRAASGHKEWSILDPKRIASVMKPQMIQETAGFFISPQPVRSMES